MSDPLLETFPLSHRLRRTVERSFGVGTFQKIAYEPSGDLGNCYWNVDKLVKEHGGSALYGWLILFWPKLYVEALHHAVWKKEDGSIVDVTGKYSTDKRDFSVFCFDDRECVNLNFPSFVPVKRYAISRQSAVQNLFRASEDQLNHKRDLISALVEAGAIWNPGGGLEVPDESDIPVRFSESLAMLGTHSARVEAAYQACAALAVR